MKLIAALIISIGVLSGCANPGIVKISNDTYMLSREDHAGVFGNAGTLKAEVIRDANAFAEKLGKIAIPISQDSSPASAGHFASFEYQFRVVEKNDPEARRAALKRNSDFVIEKNENISANITNTDTSQKQTDVYGELIKLDDLKKRGIISDSEFEMQKQKLLGGK